MYGDIEMSVGSKPQTTVEFLYGPYDGFLHRLEGNATDLAADIALPVSLNLILAASGEDHGPLLPFRHLASYELAHNEGRWRYIFTGEIVVENVDGD